MQKLKRSLRKDKRAVSPVIGVILMVAITVIMAAVIAAFVFGYGTPAAAPQASLNLVKADDSDNKVILEHQGGDSIVFANTRVIVTPDISVVGTTLSGGALQKTTGSAELGSTATFDPGEFATHATATAL